MKGSQIHFWAKMGLGKFGWGKNGTGQILVGANLALGKFGFRANLAGQTRSGQTWPGKLGLGKNGLTPIFRVLDSLGHSANYKLCKGWNSKAESGMEKKRIYMLPICYFLKSR